MEQKKIINNEAGTLSLVFLPLLACAVLMITLLLYRSHYRLLRNKVKMKFYLCERTLNIATKKYVNKVIDYDKYIRIAYYTSLIPTPIVNVSAKVTVEALKILQIKEYYQFLSRVFSNSYCDNLQKISYLMNPFKMSVLVFARKFDQTTILRSKNWTRYTSPPKGEVYFFQTKYSLENSKVTSRTTELSLEALSL